MSDGAEGYPAQAQHAYGSAPAASYGGAADYQNSAQGYSYPGAIAANDGSTYSGNYGQQPAPASYSGSAPSNNYGAQSGGYGGQGSGNYSESSNYGSSGRYGGGDDYSNNSYNDYNSGGADGGIMYLKNLPYETREDDLTAHLSSLAGLTSIVVERGAATVYFDTQDNAQKIMKFEGQDFGGRRMFISAKPFPPENNNKGGNFGGGHGGYGGGHQDRGGSGGRSYPEKFSVFVGGLDKDQTTEDNLRAYFQDCGNITGVRLMKDRETNEFKGAAFID